MSLNLKQTQHTLWILFFVGVIVLVSSTESTDLELGPLALLHQESRRSIFKDLREVVRDRTALSSLECLVGLAPSLVEMRRCRATQSLP